MKTLRLLLIVAMLFLARGAAALTPDPTTGAINAFDALGKTEALQVRNYTRVVGVADAMQTAVNEACSKAGRTLYISAGSWPMEHGVSIPCDGLQIICSSGSSFRQNARIWATQNFLASNGTRDAMFYFGSRAFWSISGCQIDSNDALVDGIRADSGVWLSIADNVFVGARSVISWRISAVDTGADSMTVSSASGYSSELTVGRHLICQAVASVGTLPTGITAGTRYWIRSKIDARTFTLSTTPGGGGSAVNITGTGSGNFYCLADIMPYATSAIDLGTKLWTIPSHGWQINNKVEICEGIPARVNGLTDGFVSAPMWILSDGFTADTFKLSTTPGGTPINWTHAGGSGQRLCLSYGPVRIGQAIYCDISHNRIVGGVFVSAGENGGEFAGAATYGCNAANFIRNQMNGDIRLHGAWFIDHNFFESATKYPHQAKIELGARVTVKDNYFELQATALSGHAIATAWTDVAGSGVIDGNHIFGPDSASGSYGIHIAEPRHTQVTNNAWNSFATALLLGGYPSGAGVSSVLTGNTLQISTTSGIGPAASSTTAETPSMVHWEDSKAGTRWLGGGTLYLQQRTGTNDTALNLDQAQHWLLTPAANQRIASVTNGTKQVARQCVTYLAPGVLGNSAVNTLSGADRQVQTGETVCWHTTAAGPRLDERLGDIVDAKTLSLSAQVSGATNIFSANVTAGEYDVQADGYVDTAGSAGTYDVEIAATDAIGARTVTVITGASLASQTRTSGRVTLRANGSSNITYRVPWTGATGSPVLTLILKTRRIR